MLGPQATLVRRRLKLLGRDTRNLWILGLQVPILGLLLALLFKPAVFDRGVGVQMSAGLSANPSFLLATVWVGALASAREIVREVPLVRRETSIGSGISAYLLSKAVVLCGLVSIQTVVLTALVLSLRPLHESSTTAALVLGILILTSWAGVGMGLLISAVASTEDQAASFIPLLLIPQLLFGSLVMPVHQMGIALKVLSKVVVVQWAFAGLGSAVQMNQRIAQDVAFRSVSRYGHVFFSISAGTVVVILLVFCALAGTALGASLRRLLRNH